MLDGALRAVQLASDGPIGKTLRQQIEDLALAARETERIGTGAGLRTALHVPRPQSMQALPDDVRRGRRAECVEDSEGLAQGGFVARKQGKPLLVGAGQAIPLGRGGAPIAGQFQCVRTCDGMVEFAGQAADSFQPYGELAQAPRLAQVDCSGKRRANRALNGVAVALQPGCFGARVGGPRIPRVQGESGCRFMQLPERGRQIRLTATQIQQGEKKPGRFALQRRDGRSMVQ